MKTLPVCTSTLYTSASAGEIPCEDGCEHLPREHAGAVTRTLPGPGAGESDGSLGVAHELDLDASASCPGGNAPDPGLPPSPGSKPSASTVLERRASTRRSALAWLARCGQ